MSATLLPFSPSHRDLATGSGSMSAPPPARTGGALTGPATPRPGRPVGPAAVLRSATLQALVRDLRRCGEALREPSPPIRQVALRRHLHFVLDELDPARPLTERLRSAVDCWRSDADRSAVREAVLGLEKALTPTAEDEGRPAAVADGHQLLSTGDLLSTGQRRATAARMWWLLDSLDEPDRATVEELLTSPRWRLARLLGQRRHRRCQLLLWN